MSIAANSFDPLGVCAKQITLFMQSSTIKVRTRKPGSRWVAINDQNKVISEGRTPESVAKKAKRVTDNFFLVFVPKPGASYIL